MRGRNSNVMPFRSPGSPGGGEWAVKLFAIVYYLFLGVLLSILTTQSIGALSFLGLLYWMFIHRRLQRTNYFSKNRVLLIILAVLFMVLFWQITIPIVILCGLYWLLIARSGKEPPYFLKFHLLNGIIFYLFVALALGIVNAVIRFAFALLFFIEPAETMTLLDGYMSGLTLVSFGLFCGTAVYFALMALMGRTPYLKYVTDNVRHWA